MRKNLWFLVFVGMVVILLLMVSGCTSNNPIPEVQESDNIPKCVGSGCEYYTCQTCYECKEYNALGGDNTKTCSSVTLRYEDFYSSTVTGDLFIDGVATPIGTITISKYWSGYSQKIKVKFDVTDGYRLVQTGVYVGDSCPGTWQYNDVANLTSYTQETNFSAPSYGSKKVFAKAIVLICEEIPNSKPTANIVITDLGGNNRRFDGSGSTPQTGEFAITSYAWEIKNEANIVIKTSTAMTFDYTLPGAGNYSAYLTVKNKCGESSTSQNLQIIQEPSQTFLMCGNAWNYAKVGNYVKYTSNINPYIFTTMRFGSTCNSGVTYFQGAFCVEPNILWLTSECVKITETISILDYVGGDVNKANKINWLLSKWSAYSGSDKNQLLLAIWAYLGIPGGVQNSLYDAANAAVEDPINPWKPTGCTGVIVKTIKQVVLFQQ